MDFEPEVYRTVISLLGIFIAVLGGILYILPVGECDECPHCRKKRLVDAEPCKLHMMPMGRCRRFHRNDEDN